MRRLSIAAALVASLPLAAVHAAGPQPGAVAEDSAQAVSLTVDAEGVPEYERADVQQWIREDGSDALTRGGVAVVADGGAFEYEVRVVVRFDEQSSDYHLAVGAWEPGGDEPVVQRRERVCKVCNRTELLAMVEDELSWMAGRLVADPQATATTDSADSTTEGAVEGADDEGSDDGQESSTGGEVEVPPPSKRLRNAGLGLVIPGGVALGVGIGFIVANERPADSADERLDGRRAFRPAGIGLAIGGGLAAIAGTTLLIIHNKRSKRGDTLGWSPIISPTEAGLSIRGSF